VPGYAYVGVGRDDGAEAGEYSAILYKLARVRVLESGTFWFCDRPDEPGCTSYGNNIPRIATWGRFADAATQHDFYMYNCHLDHQSASSRAQSVAQLTAHIRARPVQDTAVVVTGDFNAGESSQPIADMRAASFDDSFRVLYPNATNVGTFGGWVGTTTGDKIDYVFVSDGGSGMQPVQVRVWGEPAVRGGVGSAETDTGAQTLAAAIVYDNEGGRYPSDHFPVSATVIL
jgi:endonuclease/exonuclease/phosphatase family metal-dependent hydrolase